MKKRVYFTGGDNGGWALDTDLKFSKQAVGSFVKIVNKPWQANLIHSVSPLTNYWKRLNKAYVAVFPGNPNRIFEADSDFLRIARNYPCVGQSREAYDMLCKANISQHFYAPYIADLNNYYSIEDITSIRKKYGIPLKKLIIGNFMRDSLGNDLQKIKPEKGADIFCEIIKGVVKKIGQENMCVLLAGPRRHWIRKKLDSLNISYIYIGRVIKGDDYGINNLSCCEMNELINACDLILVSSRSEGGPRIILEAAQAKVPIVSSDVGIAKDILNEKSIYHNILQAQNMIIEHYYTNVQKKYCDEHYQKVNEICCSKNVGDIYKQIYSTMKCNKILQVPIQKKERKKKIGVYVGKENGVLANIILELFKEDEIQIFHEEQIRDIEVLIWMSGIKYDQNKHIECKKKYWLYEPDGDFDINKEFIEKTFDGVIFPDIDIWHYYLKKYRPFGKEIIIPNFIVPRNKMGNKLNVFLAKKDLYLQNALLKNNPYEINVLFWNNEINFETEKMDIWIENGNVEMDSHETISSYVKHKEIVTVYSNQKENKETFGVTGFGYETLQECISIISYICTDYEEIKKLYIAKEIYEVQDILMKQI